MNVIVDDRKGNPVGDLKQEDFELLDNGKPQQIRFFTVQSAGAGVSKPPELPRDVVSNEGQRGTTDQAITVILLDSVNTRFSDLAFARQEVNRFLSQIKPADHVGLYALGRDLRILNEFTSDAGSLIEKIAGGGIDLWDPNPPVADKLLWTFNAVEAIAHHLSGQPGRKNLIWVSSSFPLVYVGGRPMPVKIAAKPIMDTLTAELRHATLALNEADIAVYPVDARGLSASSNLSPTPRNPLQAVYDPWNSADPWSAGVRTPSETGALKTSSNVGTMTAFAQDTGGKAFYDSSDIKGAIRQVIDGSRVNYTLGFYPASPQADGKSHTITVRVHRHGVSARYRRGYYDAGGENATEASLRAILANPLEATGVGIMARAQHAEAGKVAVQVHVDPGISMEERDGKRVAVLDFGLVPIDDQGHPYQPVLRDMTVPFSEQAYQGFLQKGLLYRLTIERRHRLRDAAGLQDSKAVIGLASAAGTQYTAV